MTAYKAGAFFHCVNLEFRSSYYAIAVAWQTFLKTRPRTSVKYPFHIAVTLLAAPLQN